MFDQVAQGVSLRHLRLLGMILLLCPALSLAQNENLLIQLQPGGAFRIWHAEGASVLSDDEVMLLDAEAEPGGSRPIATSLGSARAVRSELGVIIELEQAANDKALLVDRDACGHLKTWHAEGGRRPTEDQAADLYMSALPGGGPRLVLDDGRQAKGFITSLGVMVAIWKARPARQ